VRVPVGFLVPGTNKRTARFGNKFKTHLEWQRSKHSYYQSIYIGSLLLTGVVFFASTSPKLPPPEKLAEAPFDDPQADLILRSSDEVHFRVLKGTLSIASPIFADMFGVPSPPSKKHYDEIQVVSVSEDSTALDVILRHIYPVRSPTAEGNTLHNVDFLGRDPVGVYAIATTYLRCATAELELLKYHVACGKAAIAVASPWLSSLFQNAIFASPCRVYTVLDSIPQTRGGFSITQL
jgi:BTB/POZ domain